MTPYTPIAASTAATIAKIVSNMVFEPPLRRQPSNEVRERPRLGHRNQRIDGSRGGSQGGETRVGVVRAAHHHQHRSRLRLRVRQVGLGPNRGVESRPARVRHDADDRHPGPGIGELTVLDPAADRIRVGPEHPGHGVVDDDRLQAPSALSRVVEESSLQQRHAHRGEVVGRDGIDRHFDPLLRREVAAAFDAEIAGIGRRAEQARCRRPRRPRRRAWRACVRSPGGRTPPGRPAAAYRSPYSVRRAVRTRSIVKPISTLWSCSKLRIIRPAPTSSTTAAATSRTTRARRTVRPRPVAPRLPSRNVRFKSTAATCSAGQRAEHQTGQDATSPRQTPARRCPSSSRPRAADRPAHSRAGA